MHIHGVVVRNEVRPLEQHLVHNKPSVNAGCCWQFNLVMLYTPPTKMIIRDLFFSFSKHAYFYCSSIFLVLPLISSIIYPLNFIRFLLVFLLLFICILLPLMSPNKSHYLSWWFTTTEHIYYLSGL